VLRRERCRQGTLATARLGFSGFLVTIPQVGARNSRARFWLAAGPIAIGLVLVVLASYHIASGNEQLAFLFSRIAP